MAQNFKQFQKEELHCIYTIAALLLVTYHQSIYELALDEPLCVLNEGLTYSG